MNYFKATYLCYVFFLFSFPFLFVVLLRSSGRSSSSSISRHTCERMCKIKYGRRHYILYSILYISFFSPQILQIRLACVVAQSGQVSCRWGSNLTTTPLLHTAQLLPQVVMCALRVGVSAIWEGRRCAVRLNKNTFCTWCETCVLFFFFLSSSASARFLAPIRLALLSELCKFLVLSRICYTLVGYVRLFVCLPASLSHCPKGIKINHTSREGEKEREREIHISATFTLTRKSFRTRAIVVGNTVHTCAAIFTGSRPAFVPIRLALYPCVSVNAIARVRAVPICCCCYRVRQLGVGATVCQWCIKRWNLL